MQRRKQIATAGNGARGEEPGAAGLRGGAFKPRTSPYAFQGLAEKGLELLALAREETAWAVVTEVMAVEQVELVEKYAGCVASRRANMPELQSAQTPSASKANRCS